MPDAIALHNITKTFGSKLAVRDLNLTVPAGSLCGFIGPNGAGKTTTIRMILSILLPDKGRIEVLGKPSAAESKDRIGYLPEERGTYRKMRVLSFLTYMANLKGLDTRTAKTRAARWLERVQMGEVGRKRCEELSKGMQQKIQFIAAVIHEPELLILDEVFSGLDPMNRRLMRELIDEQHREGRTIVFSTHAMYEAEQLCDRIFMIHQGVKKLDMPMSEVWKRYEPHAILIEPLTPAKPMSDYRITPGVLAVTPTPQGMELRLDPSADPGQIMVTLAAAGDLRKIELKRPTLEDVFFQLVGEHAEPVASDDQREEPLAAGITQGGVQ